jgi:NAD(P)-dependent dehydrogenase (short-subunit alcohol dehydrogenase family)
VTGPTVTGPADGLVVVAGATGAFGSATVTRLVARGCPVLAVARDPKALEDLAAAHPGVVPCPADVADDSAVDTIGAAVARIGRPVRMAVFAVGLPARGAVTTIEPGALVAGAGTKLGGLLRLVRAVDPHLSRPQGRIVAFAGSFGLEPRWTEAGPGAVNAAVLNLMRQLSQVYGPQGITTHTLCPGPADTPRLRAIVAERAAVQGTAVEQEWQHYLGLNSLGRLPTAAEVAWAVGLLLEPEADLLHGSVMYLDAGGHHGIH